MSALLTVLVACAVAIFIVLVFARWVEAGLVCLLAVALCNMTFGSNATLVGRLHLSALDVVSAGLLMAGVLRLTRNMRLLTWSRLIAVGYALLLLWSFLRGYAANGLFAAANEARGFVGPLAAMLYFADAPVDPDSLRRYVRWYLLLAACLCLVAVLAVAGVPVGVAAWAHSAAEIADHRVLASGAGAVLAICGFLALARAVYSSSGFIAHLLPAMFFLIAIYLRHRTVWVMLLTGVVALGFVDGRLFRRITPLLLLASAAVAGLVLVESNQLDMANQGDFAESLSNADTWQWRVNGWREFLLDSDQTVLASIAGRPMGSGWWRIDPGSHLLQTAPPHSEYVTEYLRVGAAGLLLVMLFACRPLSALARIPAMDGVATYP